MTWIDCICDNDYQIFSEEPFQIRRKSNRKIIKESLHKSSGYIRCVLNQKSIYKHTIIAKQFIPNPNNYNDVDHKNRIRTDNRIDNLHWVSRSDNLRNRISNGDFIYNYVDELSENSFQIEEYGKYRLDKYFYDVEVDKFYLFNNNQYKELKVCIHPTGSLVNVQDINGNKFCIKINKFKRIYNIEN